MVASSVSTFEVTGAVISSQETMALTEDVMTTRLIVGNLSAEVKIPTVPLIAGIMMSRL